MKNYGIVVVIVQANSIAVAVYILVYSLLSNKILWSGFN